MVHVPRTSAGPRVPTTQRPGLRAGAATSARVSVAPARAWRTFAVPAVTRGAAVAPVDWVRAHADARLVLDSLDLSRRDIVIWVPDAAAPRLDPTFEDAARQSWSDVPAGGATIASLRYPTESRGDAATATGVATLRIVLEELARRGGHHRVLLAGQGAGAAVIGETLAQPGMRARVGRALLFDHPVAAAHDYADGRDAGIVEVGEQDAADARDGAGLLRSLIRRIPGAAAIVPDRADHAGDMTRAIEFLRFGAEAGSPIS